MLTEGKTLVSTLHAGTGLVRGPVHPRPCRTAALSVVAGTRREVVLRSVNVGVLGALFTFGAAPRPKLGVQDIYGTQSLGLCPSTPNCISTAEEANMSEDLKGGRSHYVPQWSYNPVPGRGRIRPVSQQQAMEELSSVVSSIKPDNFTPTVITQTSDYLYAEFQSPTFGFIDDVEFWFPDNKQKDGIVEYRSASRIGESDGDINRKRIKAIRLELEKKGWKGIGFS
ncbi:hypothetical protein ABBQ32_003775 [Trebouxia sp. C0010 RCD-2024]